MTETIIGVVIGYLLGLLEKLVSDRHKSQRTSRNVRTLLSIEIDTDLLLLRDFWQAVVKEEPIDDNDSQAAYLHSQSFISIPFPGVTDIAFRSQLTELPSAFTAQEIKAVYGFHNTIDQFRVSLR